MFNPMQLIQFMQSGGNPQQLMQQDPNMQKLLQGVNTNSPQAMEQLCRNVCMQKGLDFDTMVAQFRQQGGKL